MANGITPFDQALSQKTGIDPRVIGAWRTAEGGPSNNPLNIGPFRHFSDPVASTAKLILGSHYYKGILANRGNPAADIQAIKASPWDASHYANGVLDRTASAYGLKGGKAQPPISAGQSSPASAPSQQPSSDSSSARDMLLQHFLGNLHADATGQNRQPFLPIAQKIYDIQRSAPSGESLPPISVVSDHGQPLSPSANGVVNLAERYIGTPYKWGGASPKTGFDCSGFVQWLYAQKGVQLPRTTYQQIQSGAPVDMKNLAPGDIVFFSKNGDVHHEGLYIGHGQFIHSPHTGDSIKISSLSDPYYQSQFAGGRRIQGA